MLQPGARLRIQAPAILRQYILPAQPHGREPLFVNVGGGIHPPSGLQSWRQISGKSTVTPRESNTHNTDASKSCLLGKLALSVLHDGFK